MKQARKPDLKAPRFRQQVFGTLNKQSLQHMREELPHLGHLTDKQVKDFLFDTNRLIYEHVIANRDGVELPEQLGSIFIGTCQPRIRKSMNYQASLVHGQVLGYRNWESDSFLAKIFYTNYSSKYRFKHHDLWSFEPIRQFKRTVAKTYPENWKMYIQVDHTLKISSLFRKAKAREYFKADQQRQLQEYNDLDI